jgi:hypothetical protein
MRVDSRRARDFRLNSRKTRARLIRAAGCALLLGGLSGCNEDEANRAFREAAASSLQSGAISAITGLIEGSFALWELDTQPPQNETPGTDDAGSSG